MRPKLIFGFLCSAIISVIITLNTAMAQNRQGRAWYVNNSGADNGTGSKKAPFKTVNRINSVRLRTGDTVYFRSGQTFEGTLELKEGLTGSKRKPIVIKSYGKGRAIIDGKDSSGIRVYKGSFIKLEHLYLKGSGRKTGNVKDGLAILNCKNIEINDLNISGFQKSGLLI